MLDARFHFGNGKMGALTAGPKIVDRSVEKKMAMLLRDIRSGKFAREWIRETKTGRKRYSKMLEQAKRHPMEKVGKRLRGLMAWSARKQKNNPEPA